MKKIALFLCAAALAGCCHTRVVSDGPHEVVEVDNACCRLFGFIPLFSGDPDYPNREVSAWFCDTLTLDVNMALLDQTLRENGYTGFKNITTYRTKETALLQLISRVVLHTSAEPTK